MEADFDWVRHSDLPDPSWEDFRFKSLFEMVNVVSNDADSSLPIFIGIIDGQRSIVRLSDLQSAIRSAKRWRTNQNLPIGSRVMLVRLPYCSELVIAVNALALMAIGVSVVLPTEGVNEHLEDLLVRSDSQRLLYPTDRPASELQTQTRIAADRLGELARKLGIPQCPIPVQLQIPVHFQIPNERASEAQRNSFNRDVNDSDRRPMEKTSLDCYDEVKNRLVSQEVLVLTTSASTGRPKLVRYSEKALLTVAEAWNSAGLFDHQLTGGPSICPLVSHSMGMRNILHAVWTRQPTLMIPPEWMREAPHRALQLLQDLPPSHLTAGPALIDAIAQLSNVSPEARKALRSLRVVVSSGSTSTHRNVTAFAGARSANAFGMTETQQVLSTLLSPHHARYLPADASSVDSRSESAHSQPLGLPLPGASVAVRFDNPTSSTGRMYVRSVFKAIGYVGQDDFGDWLDTGDMVRVVHDQLEYVGRCESDFLSLGTGLKVAVEDLRRRYKDLQNEFPQIVFRQSAGRTGVVALIYCGAHDPASPELHRRVHERIAAIHDHADRIGADFHLRHSPLVAAGLLAGEAPRLGIGKPNLFAIEKHNRDLMQALDDAEGRHPHLIEFDPPDLSDDAWYQSSMPLLGSLMQALKLDLEFTEGRGDQLIARQGGREQHILDLVGGYGANLLGHGRDDLRKVAVEALNEIPLLDQGSRRSAASRLATQLSNRVGRETGRRYVCLLSSTGSEAVETALKHALLRWRRRCEEVNTDIKLQFGATHPNLVAACCEENQRQFDSHQPLLIALEGGFHGKTTGALNAMSDESQRKPFDRLLGARTEFIPRVELPAAAQWLDRICSRQVVRLQRPHPNDPENQRDEVLVSGVVAVIAEPIQGEGGIFEVPRSFFDAVKTRGLPLIADEIQSGLGRSGRFVANPGIKADYYLFGKSLGGGIAKIAATLVDREVYENQFDLNTGATFSADRFACAAASKALEIIDADDVPNRAERLGKSLGDGLINLQKRFPNVITMVSGRGAMFGVSLQMPENTNRFLQQLAASRLGYVAASYLLNRHRIRILPTLSAPSVLRIEPSAYFTDSDVNRMLQGLADLCERLVTNDVAGLISHWANDSSFSRSETDPCDQMENLPISASTPSPASRRATRSFSFQQEAPSAGARRVGFVFNPLYPADELLVEVPEFSRLSTEKRWELVQRLQTVMELRPFELFSKNLFNGRVWMCGIVLPVSPQVLSEWHRRDELAWARRQLDEAVMLASKQGCQTVVMGAQTSIVTRNATTVSTPPGIQVASGNTFTVASMLSSIETERLNRGIPNDVTVGIVGATGNIGSAVARWYARKDRWSGRLTLFGRSGAERRLGSLRDSLLERTTAQQIDVCLDPHRLRECGLIVVAVGGERIAVQSRHVHPSDNVLIADVSQPRAVSPNLQLERPNAKVIQTGLVRLKEDRKFRLTPHTPAGTCFACAAEAILMGLEPQPIRLRGEIDPDAIEILQRLGKRFGMLPA